MRRDRRPTTTKMERGYSLRRGKIPTGRRERGREARRTNADVVGRPGGGGGDCVRSPQNTHSGFIYRVAGEGKAARVNRWSRSRSVVRGRPQLALGKRGRGARAISHGHEIKRTRITYHRSIDHSWNHPNHRFPASMCYACDTIDACRAFAVLSSKHSHTHTLSLPLNKQNGRRGKGRNATPLPTCLSLLSQIPGCFDQPLPSNSSMA